MNPPSRFDPGRCFDTVDDDDDEDDDDDDSSAVAEANADDEAAPG